MARWEIVVQIFAIQLQRQQNAQYYDRKIKSK